MRDYLPTATLDILRLRAALLKRLRSFFDQREFLEVTTPVLSADTVIDEHLDPLSTIVFGDPQQPAAGPTRYLQTSPEFHMKRLLVAGLKRIYQIGPAFRGAESGDLHNHEFTMVEWYRVGDNMQAGMDLLAEVASTLFSVESERDQASQNLARESATRPPIPTSITIERLSYSAAFQRIYDHCPHTATGEQLVAIASRIRSTAATDTRDDLLNLLWSHGVEPSLGQSVPVIIHDYPASQAALARIRQEGHPSPDVAERFELYYRGIELANGYHELTDPTEMRRRNARINDLREAAGKPRLPEQSRLLEAMEAGLPSCSGVALGFDRALMIAAKKARLSQILAFPDAIA